MKKTQIKRVILYGLMVFLVLSMMACGKNTNEGKGETQTEEDSQNQTVEEEALYLIVKHDAMEESLILYSYDTGLEHYYDYSLSTQFKDKHGNYTPAAEFTEGRVVTVGERDYEGYLKEIQLTNQVWEYEKIRRFSVDELKGVLTIADTRYSIRDKVYVFSNGERISLADLSKEEDVLTVVGKGKQILSIVVTTGHGSLVLRNTTLFDGSFLQLNNDIFTIISDSLEVDLPEGHYTLKIANNGWGGTTEIDIVRGETTEVDLDALKGEGRKKGIVRFEIDVDNLENLEVMIDHEKIDPTQPIELTYGTHLLEIKAEGYDKWKKHLSVNSEDATISIELTESEKKNSEKEESKKEDSEKEDTEEKESETERTTEEETP